MIQIRIAEADDQIRGRYECKARQSLKHSVKGAGTVEANYLYHKSLYSIVASLQAMSVIPCDVDVRIEVGGGRVHMEGFVLLYVPSLHALTASIQGVITAHAYEAFCIGPASQAKVTFLQTCDRQNFLGTIQI